MKKCRLIISLFALTYFLTDCSHISNEDKNEAKNIFTTCNPIAELWLKELDKNGYTCLTNLKLPDFLKKELNEDEVIKYSLNIEKIFGRVQERKFIGAHFWLHNKLITYLPDYDKKLMDRMGQKEARDGFYKINPRYMGLKKSADMFQSFPDGNYLILMYKSVPTKKPTAGEMVILWQDSTDTWQVVSYKIADDV